VEVSTTFNIAFVYFKNKSYNCPLLTSIVTDFAVQASYKRPISSMLRAVRVGKDWCDQR